MYRSCTEAIPKLYFFAFLSPSCKWPCLPCVHFWWGHPFIRPSSVIRRPSSVIQARGFSRPHEIFRRDVDLHGEDEYLCLQAVHALAIGVRNTRGHKEDTQLDAAAGGQGMIGSIDARSSLYYWDRFGDTSLVLRYGVSTIYLSTAWRRYYR